MRCCADLELIVLLRICLLALLCAGSACAKPDLVSHLVLTAPSDAFGGFSAIEVSEDGARFTALTDRGSLATGTLVREGDVLTGVTDLEFRPLEQVGQAGSLPRQIDSEGLALAGDGTLFISFELVHRVWRYTEAGGGERLPAHPDFDNFQMNSGLEALAIDTDGALYAVQERSGAKDRPFPVYRFDGAAWSKPFTIARRGEYLPTGADVHGGRLYLLERGFTGFAFRSRIRSVALDGTDEREHLETAIFDHGNLEGLSIWEDAGGALRATMISDDNFNPLQTTEIVEYRLD